MVFAIAERDLPAAERVLCTLREKYLPYRPGSPPTARGESPRNLQMTHLGILLSGRGSNFVAIADSIAAGHIDAQISVVISNRETAPGLAIARERGLKAVCIPSKGLDRIIYDRMVIEELKRNEVELVCLARIFAPVVAGFCSSVPTGHSQHSPVAAASIPGSGRSTPGTGIWSQSERMHGPLRRRASGFRPDYSAIHRSSARRRHSGLSLRPHSQRGAPRLQRSHSTGGVR